MPLTAAMVGAFVAEARGVLPDGLGTWVALGLVLVWAAAFAAVRFGRGRLAMVTAGGIDREILVLRGVHPDARRALVASHAIRRTLPPAG